MLRATGLQNHMKDTWPTVVGAVLGVGIGVVQTIWRSFRARKMLDRWAKDQGYTILSAHRLWYRRGPFSWSSTGNQAAYHVVVRSDDGWTADVWVRFGDQWWGLLQYKVEEKWLT